MTLYEKIVNAFCIVIAFAALIYANENTKNILNTREGQVCIEKTDSAGILPEGSIYMGGEQPPVKKGKK